MTEFEARLAAVDESARRRVYELLWLELTIVGRAVWSDSELNDQEKLEGLKWLNEIQHRVWGAHVQGSVVTPAHLVGTIQHHAEQAPVLQGYLSAACRRALRALEPR
ncbi:MAG TPA: hypothetical protein VHI31_08855 [Actinomycetota bacterium]|nr:hypothetical protein [Actinomycetota bacterium]